LIPKAGELKMNKSSIKSSEGFKNLSFSIVPKFVGNLFVHFPNKPLRLSLYQVPAG